eukprot:126297-Pelagomonas_calceolata.AAC.7
MPDRFCRSASASAAARARALLKAQLNAYAEPYQDVALASLHGHVLRAHVGIWPAHALLNHSCSPNACTLVVGELCNPGSLLQPQCMHLDYG